MQFFTTTTVAAFAAALTTQVATANPLMARNGLEPDVNQEYICYTNDKSAGVSNIEVGVQDMKTWDETKTCASNSDGSAARMAAGDGYSFYIVSTIGQSVDAPLCSTTVADLIQKLEGVCGQLIGGDIRAEGSIWIPGYEGYTYVYTTGESK